ncbi:ATP-binding protein [Piscinibacter sp.]|uniref:ATP-binding protein n=1 Tax=Piscinibacter sp. TaxID=1903157 RepID=UPI002F42EADF
MAMVIAGFEAVDEPCTTPAWQIRRARRLGDDAFVLVKLLQPENAAPAQLAHFRQEYELLRTLDVPGIVKPLALVWDQGRSAMVLEDFEGRSLEGMLDTGKLNLQTGLGIASALANTLAGLHAAGVVHQDVRPTNIFVATHNAAVRLVDCRLATRQAREMLLEAQGNAVEGDWAYFSPEQTGRVNRDIDERADLYALGVTLYRIFTGELPFHATDPLERLPRPLQELAPELPSAVNDVVMRLLAKMPEDRYQSARGVHFDLEQCRAQWAQRAAITPFALGSHDICEPLQAMNHSLQVLDRGCPLDEVLKVSDKYLAFARQSHNDAVVATIQFLQQLVANLKGLTHAPGRFDDDHFDESECLAVIDKASFGPGIVACLIMKEIAAFTFGHYAAAREAAESACAALPQAGPLEATHHFYHALILIALFPDATETQRAELVPVLNVALQRLKRLADNGPERFLTRYALASAEMIRVRFDSPVEPADARDLEAMRLYEQAIQLAHTHGLVQNEALAHELAARFCRERGFATSADAHLGEARACYARWGADGKVRQLEAQHRRIAATPAVNGAAQLDALSMLKASQAISGDILLDHLLKTLLCTVMESAGAEKGLLFLVREDELVLAAEGRVEGEQVQALLSGSQPLQAASAPASILNDVRRSHEKLVLADASAANPFPGDDYLRQHAPKSVLCLPILRQGELSGLLYLENNLITHAFTPERLAMLELLASQAAISLENAQLYADLKLENWQAEAELLEREAHVRRLVDSNIIGIFFWDFDGGIVDANDAFLQITGYTRADLEEGNIDWAAMTPPEYAAADKRAVQELRQNGTSLQYEKEYITKDGQRAPVLVGGALLEGSREMGIAFVLDLTERKRADAELRARQAADAANEAKSQFLANMSHELRTPLNAILGYAQLLLNDEGRDERTAAGLDTIRQSGELLLTLINDILDVAAIESGKMALYPDAVDLQAFLRAVADIVRVKADQKNLLLTLHTAPGLAPIVQVDEKRLRQVLLNLLSNAVKFTDAGEVQLRVYPLGPAGATVRLRFEVKDSGIGIGPEQLAAIFEPFVQAPDVQRRFGGTGLGLSISRQLLGLMGSDIHVDSRVGQGSCFRFDLELPVETDATRVATAAPRRIVTGYTGARRRLLVVDDNATNRMPLLDLLAPLGFEVFAADNGQTGVELAQTLRPDLILMDAVMPVMDGLDATRRLRAMPQTRGVPIIIVSAGATADDQRNGLEVGANAFLPKPLDMHRLLAEIGTLLGLTWLPDASNAPADGAAPPLVAPPAEELEVLYQLARTGNMRRIRERAEHIASLGAEYRGFADTLLQLAGRFQSRAILDLVAQYLQQASQR